MHTTNIEAEVRQADIVVFACGKAKIGKKEWFKPGAVVVDAGEDIVDDPEAKNGWRLVGDVDREDVMDIVGKLSPVPGGVGPMTVAVLLQNTINSARFHFQKNSPKK